MRNGHQTLVGVSSPTPSLTLLTSDDMTRSPLISTRLLCTPGSCDVSEMFGFCISSFLTHCDQTSSRNDLWEERFVLAQEGGIVVGAVWSMMLSERAKQHVTPPQQTGSRETAPKIEPLRYDHSDPKSSLI